MVTLVYALLTLKTGLYLVLLYVTRNLVRGRPRTVAELHLPADRENILKKRNKRKYQCTYLSLISIAIDHYYFVNLL
ncbi:hypothetical protein XELAEV_18012312mg [Xenopus laevis]|uniref:Uncharacterized protein n=1 Tax=Xenopus laevis TaxID=8355 RepID=A0A974DMG7_XENLA|nr:hypothetical protein XELAEV_18012312mg [Xenopus laevis]